MVIYEREKKTLIIPTGIGNVSYGGESYEQGVSDGKTAQEAADRAKLTTRNITANGSYEAPYGYSRVNVNVPTSGSGDCSEAIATAYESGRTAGLSECPECSGGTSCNLEAGVVNLIADGPTWITYPFKGYDGFSEVTINDMGYGQGKYNEGYQSGYTAGQADCPACDCTEAYDNGYSNGYSDGYIKSKDDMTEITPASSVTLTEYGTYYFTYDENTDLQSMLVNFAHTQPQPPHSGSTSGYSGFVRIQSFGNKNFDDFALYNEDADDSTLLKIEINGVEYSGGSRYTGSASQITYIFEGQIPDNFWSGWSVDGTGFSAEMHFESMLIGKNAFKNSSIGKATIFTNKECIIDEGAFENTTIWNMHLLQYKSGGTFTFNHNSFKDNTAFKRLKTYMRSMVINGDSSLFANSMANGTAIIDSRVSFEDVQATQWWQTLENQGWTAENN